MCQVSVVFLYTALCFTADFRLLIRMHPIKENAHKSGSGKTSEWKIRATGRAEWIRYRGCWVISCPVNFKSDIPGTVK